MTSHRWHQLVLGVITVVITCTCATTLASAGNLFTGPINSPAGRYPWALAAGDFDGDGNIDLAVTNNDNSDTPRPVKILLGQGDGLFQDAVGYKVGAEPLAVAVGDFNRDGNADLVVANHSRPNHPGKIRVLLGNGDGTFQKQTTYKAGNNPIDIAMADFNGDGKLDLAVIRISPSQTMAILLGNGDGTFQPQMKIPGLAIPHRIVVGDLNGDGIPDLVISGGNNKKSVISLLGNGDGTFRIVWTLKGPRSSTIGLGDFNGDGKLDLAQAVGPPDSRSALKIWSGNGDGTFQAGSEYPVSGGLGALTVSDFDGDGNLDVAAVSSQGVSVFLGLGNGKFQQPQGYALSPAAGPAGMITADVNGDLKPDLVVTDWDNHVVSVLLNTGKR